MKGAANGLPSTCLIKGTRPFLVDNLLRKRCTTISLFDFTIDLDTFFPAEKGVKTLYRHYA
jgi:uncharacterized protein YcaQ